MQLLTLMRAKKLNPDEYMDVYLVNSQIETTKVQKRWIGWLTIGISNYFTRPWINVYGKKNCLNQVKYEKLKQDCLYECINCLSDDFDLNHH